MTDNTTQRDNGGGCDDHASLSLVRPAGIKNGGATGYSGLEFTFHGRVVVIGCPVGGGEDVSGESRVYYLRERAGQRLLEFCIRLTPSAHVWEQELTGLDIQNTLSLESAHILGVENHGMYKLKKSSPGNEGSDDDCRRSGVPEYCDIDKQEERGVFAILPLCRGGDLFDMAASPSMLQRTRAIDLIDVCRFLLRALRRLRDERVVHGDIKPENICFQQTGRGGVPFFSTLTLIDFGFAFVDHGNTVLTSGTYGYLAPEVYDNRRGHRITRSTYAIDVFGVGATMFVLCNEWLRHHHYNTQYPGQVMYERYIQEMRNHSPRDREEVYRSTYAALSKGYESKFHEDRDGIVVAQILQHVVSRMTAFEPKARPSPDEALELLRRIKVYNHTVNSSNDNSDNCAATHKAKKSIEETEEVSGKKRKFAHTFPDPADIFK